MKIVVFGLTISSSWGNGHATLWRGLIRALHDRGHYVTFFEKDVPYYASTRDLHELPGGKLRLYSAWESAEEEAARELSDADAAIVTSYCPDGPAATNLVLACNAAVKAFYDLDTPVTLQQLSSGERPAYLPQGGLSGFDLVLSFAGGEAIERLRSQLGARQVAPLYGHVDPHVHRPVPPTQGYRSDLSYLGTYAADRQPTLEKLFVEPARLAPQRRFVIGGTLYPQEFPWTANIFFVRHMPPSEHPAFFCSSRMTLNVTRAPMARPGYCPSGRLFEAAACGTAILTDWWEGLDTFFTPRSEILVVRSPREVVAALELSDAELSRIGEAAYVRVIEKHSSKRRAAELEILLERAAAPRPIRGVSHVPEDMPAAYLTLEG